MSFLAFRESELQVSEALSTRDVEQFPFHVGAELDLVQVNQRYCWNLRACSRVFAANRPLADDASVKPSEDYWRTGLLLASLEWAALQSLWVGGIG